MSVYACVTAYAHSVCLCDSALMCTHMHAYAHAINKPPSVPPTQLDCDGMSRYNPHRPEKSLSLACTQSHTHAHTCPLYKTLLNHILSSFVLLRQSLSPSAHFSTLSPSFPLPRFPGHTFRAELQPARTRSMALLQSPEELPSTTARCVNMSACRFVYRPFTHHHHQQRPQKLYSTLHAKIW